MKLFSVSLFLATFIVFNGIAQVTDFSAILLSAVNGLRSAFATGFPALGLPSLDPLFVPSFSSDVGTMDDCKNIELAVFNTTITGFTNFQITTLAVSLQNLSLSFGITHPKLQFKGTHEMTGKLQRKNFHGRGPFDATIKTLHIEVFIKLGTNPLKITTQEISKASVGDAVSNFKGFERDNRWGRSSHHHHHHHHHSEENTGFDEVKISKCFERGVKNWFKNSIAVISARLETTFTSLANPLLGLFNDANAFFDAIVGN